MKSCADEALADLLSLDDQMRARLEWSDVDLMRSILLFWTLRAGSSPKERVLKTIVLMKLNEHSSQLFLLVTVK